MSKKKPSVRNFAQPAPPKTNTPEPNNPFFMRGREAALKFTAELCHDELAQALLGFREGVLSHIRDHQAKLDAAAEHLVRAEEAINP